MQVNYRGNFEQVLDALNKTQAAYMVIGGHAVSFHGYVRGTHDLDIWVNTTGEENKNKVLNAIDLLGFDISSLVNENFEGKPPIKLLFDQEKVELIHGLPGWPLFDEAYSNSSEANFGDVKAKFIGYSDLIRLKKLSNRIKDIYDIKQLEEIKNYNNRTLGKKPKSFFDKVIRLFKKVFVIV